MGKAPVAAWGFNGRFDQEYKDVQFKFISIYVLLNDALGSSDYKGSNDSMNNV